MTPQSKHNAPASGPNGITVCITAVHRRWSTHIDAASASTVHATGHAFCGDRYLPTDELAAHVAQTFAMCPISAASTRSAISQLNGHWAFIVQQSGSAILAVDRSRSTPLFHNRHGTRAIIGDDANAIRIHLGRSEPHEIAWLEYLLCGYVTGAETLFAEIEQVPAGEFAILRPDPDGVAIERHRHYAMLPIEQHAPDVPAMRRKLVDVLDRLTQRLIVHAAGRPLVLPLSGGLDSRLLGAMLKRHGQRDVLCYTYGRPENPEVKISRAVADALGYRWEFFPYNPSIWRDAMHESRMQDYWQYAAMLSSLPLLQEYPALAALGARPELKNALYVPGHTLDMLSGGHIRWPLDDPRVRGRNVDDATDLVLSNEAQHFVLWPWSTVAPSWRTQLRRRVAHSVNVFAEYPFATNAHVSQMWNHQNRQARFIIHGIRAYEFFGGEWALPGWDHELMDFFMAVPLPQLHNKTLYIDTCLSEVFQGPLRALAEIDLGASLPSAAPSKRVNRIKSLAYALPLVGDWRAVRRHGPATDIYAFRHWFMDDGNPWKRIRDMPIAGPNTARLPAAVGDVITRNRDTLAIRAHMNGLLSAHVLYELAGAM